MTPPEDVARAWPDRVQRGDEDIFPDSMSQLLAEGWRVGVGKTLERQNVALVDGRADRGLSEKTAPMRATMTTRAIVARDEWQAPGPRLSGRRHTPGWATSWRDSDGRFPGFGSTRSTRGERPPDRKLLLMPATACARATFKPARRKPDSERGGRCLVYPMDLEESVYWHINQLIQEAEAERLVALLPRRALPGQLRLPRVVRVRIAEGLFALARWLSPEVARNEAL